MKGSQVEETEEPQETGQPQDITCSGGVRLNLGAAFGAPQAAEEDSDGQ